MKSEGFSLGDNQQVHVDIVRSMFDGKSQQFYLEQVGQVANYVPLLTMN